MTQQQNFMIVFLIVHAITESITYVEFYTIKKTFEELRNKLLLIDLC